MRAGRLARRDPEIVARAFVGSVHHFVVFDLLFQAQDTMPMPEETFLRGVVDLLFRGCLLYTSDAADERSSVSLGGRRIIKKKNSEK